MRNSIKIITIFFLLTALLLSGCSRTPVPLSSTDSGNITPNASDSSIVPEPQKTSKQTMNISDFERLLSEQPLTVSKTEYIVQDEQYKSLYPDILRADLKNNTEADIRDVVVAFAAWDENNLPVKIKGQFDFSGGSYIKKVNYSDINLIGGGSFAENSGLSLDDSNNIASFKAIVASFETFDGQTWENPYFETFCKLYEGVKYSDDLTVEIKLVENKFTVIKGTAENSSTTNSMPTLDAPELESKLSEQPLAVIKTEYVVQDERYKSLYPDMLQAVLQNNSTADIKDAVIAFAAWDENGLPVKIEGQFDFSGGSYIKKVDYSDINLIGGATFGENSGFSLDESNNIASFKAIAVSYEDFDGNRWENPYYDDFCRLYEGQRLK